MGTDDEFIVNDDENGNGANGSPPAEDANNRTFLVTASLLTGTLLLLSLVSVGFLLMNRSGDRTEAVAAIETQNAVILATNAAVTITIEAQELAALATQDQASIEGAPQEEATPDDSRLVGGISPEDATATTEALATIAADPTLAAAATVAAEQTIAADPTLVAAVTEAAGGATPALPADPTATDEVEASATPEAEASPTAEVAAGATSEAAATTEASPLAPTAEATAEPSDGATAEPSDRATPTASSTCELAAPLSDAFSSAAFQPSSGARSLTWVGEIDSNCSGQVSVSFLAGVGNGPSFRP